MTPISPDAVLVSPQVKRNSKVHHPSPLSWTISVVFLGLASLLICPAWELGLLKPRKRETCTGLFEFGRTVKFPFLAHIINISSLLASQQVCACMQRLQNSGLRPRNLCLHNLLLGLLISRYPGITHDICSLAAKPVKAKVKKVSFGCSSPNSITGNEHRHASPPRCSFSYTSNSSARIDFTLLASVLDNTRPHGTWRKGGRGGEDGSPLHDICLDWVFFPNVCRARAMQYFSRPATRKT